MLNKEHDQEVKEFVLNNIVAYCDKCGTKYKPQDLAVIYNNTNSVVIQATCPKCGSKYIVQLMHPLNATQKLPVILDIAPHEIQTYIKYGPVTNDYILHLHSILFKDKKLTLKDFIKAINNQFDSK